MKAFFMKWWGKFKSSPMYVKAGIVALLFFAIYMLFIRKTGEYDNVVSAEVTNPTQDTDDGYTYTPPTSNTSDSMDTENAYKNQQKLYEAQIAEAERRNQELANQLNNYDDQKPTVKDYLNPVIANVAGNWLSSLINPSKSSISTQTANTSSPVSSASKSYVYTPAKSNTSTSSSLKNSFGNYFSLTPSTSSTNTNVWSSTNNFTSGTYTGFGSDSYAKTNYGW